jgi:hypothetical protein
MELCSKKCQQRYEQIRHQKVKILFLIYVKNNFVFRRLIVNKIDPNQVCYFYENDSINLSLYRW